MGQTRWHGDGRRKMENGDAVENVSREREGGRKMGCSEWAMEDVEESQGGAQPCMLMSHHYMLL